MLEHLHLESNMKMCEMPLKKKYQIFENVTISKKVIIKNKNFILLQMSNLTIYYQINK